MKKINIQEHFQKEIELMEKFDKLNRKNQLVLLYKTEKSGMPYISNLMRMKLGLL